MKKQVITDLGWAVGIIGLALAATWARRQGLVDGETVTRLVIGATGLMVASFGNRMPKAFTPNALARKVARVGGWSLALSGLVYAALWAFAPIDVAVVAGCAAILAGIAAPIGYCFVLKNRARASGTI